LREIERRIERRARREPLQYILGSWPFLELDLRVDARALVPRAETEDLALEARRRLRELSSERPLVLDVGTGSGCIALAVASAITGALVAATDRSAAALRLAATNAHETGLERRVAFVAADLMAPFVSEPRFDLIVANLPYVAPSEIEDLSPEVRDWEPREALIGEEGGLGPIRRLLAEAPSRLRAGGSILLEIGETQAPQLTSLLARPEWTDTAVLKDRYGRPRIAAAKRRAAA
jgi:release factor glutamine methyltransferase